MWVADMDLLCPEPVRRAVEERAAHGVYGYTVPSPRLKRAIVENARRAWGTNEVVESWIRFHPGLIAGLYHTARLVPGGGVIVPTPVYPPFLNAARETAACIDVPAGDLGELEAAIAGAPYDRLVVMWCNPHNPTGRVWPRSDLEHLAHLVDAYGDKIVAVCSDEVWSGLVFDDDQTPFTSLGELAFSSSSNAPFAQALRDRLVVLTSPSKTYNVAALDFAIAIVPNDSLRRQYFRNGRDQAECTPFGFAAAEAIFVDNESDAQSSCDDLLRPPGGDCEPWRRAVVSHLRANRDLAIDFIRAHCAPEIQIPHVPEASYLLWLDASGLGRANPAVHLRDTFSLGLSDGAPFFGNTKTPGFVRMNFGCSRATLQEGLLRLRAAVDDQRRLSARSQVTTTPVWADPC
ncbi:hypothetical protein CTAYLR_006847 [Chrysophaeum taylorii]|uniref:cysteine-S-conjugate beta-lyase n=1 Tax=Chrysophaeum taylorii TaxID=2483200 RepID=A0AAD7U644_9STRA|nr:hypothetical protein CTAYLR_006847 [Chrysophaeum taylorii]